MSKFSRIKTSWFKPKAEPSRKPRVASKAAGLTDSFKPTVDERTALAAAEILENGSFERVFKRLRQTAIADFVGAAPGHAGLMQRELAHQGITVLDQIEAEIKAMADQMKLHRRQPQEN